MFFSFLLIIFKKISSEKIILKQIHTLWSFKVPYAPETWTTHERKTSSTSLSKLMIIMRTINFLQYKRYSSGFCVFTFLCVSFGIIKEMLQLKAHNIFKNNNNYTFLYNSHFFALEATWKSNQLKKKIYF